MKELYKSGLETVFRVRCSTKFTTLQSQKQTTCLFLSSNPGNCRKSINRTQMTSLKIIQTRNSNLLMLFLLQKASLWTSVHKSLIIKAKVYWVNCQEIKFYHHRWKTRKEIFLRKVRSLILKEKNKPLRAFQFRSSPYSQHLETKTKIPLIPQLLRPLSQAKVGRTIHWVSWPESSSDLSKLQRTSARIWTTPQRA